ncbi:thiosulfate oxidation carrier protein SoxY [Methylobacillus gramineus]|uniref:thiosulfate oxidation carrier protein SoxY n=1 Tax=Methylobacillus gramineus TaxID=755169 RepID=UPI001D0016A3|nr:thiosulfate oxidation carrier protein SoxY [Methylobacillus gramineus]MCB5185581.1 thiosulfate oxidation carrier protein SoxY [Methylobacillus gramineus]
MTGRRSILQVLLAGLLLPLKAIAASWNTPAFEARTIDGAKQVLNMRAEENTAQIEIVAPDFAENGAVVQVEVMSRIAGTEAMAIFAEKNPVPLVANFTFSHGAQPYVITRIKMAESQSLQVVVKVGERYYQASRYVTVSEGGCG